MELIRLLFDVAEKVINYRHWYVNLRGCGCPLSEVKIYRIAGNFCG